MAEDIEEHPDPHEHMIIASVSGGKDSTAMSLWLTEQGIEHKRVFADTGWEHESTMDYVNNYLPDIIGPIDHVAGPRTMEELIMHKGMFPTRLRRFCTEHLKVNPIKKYLEKVDPERNAVNCVGLRAQESLARSVLDEWEHDTRPRGVKRWVWRPLIKWSYQDVIDIHTRHAVRPNPLYLSGSERVGCWPCIFARKSEIRHIADHDPDRIDLLRVIEANVAEAALKRYEAKGETMESLGYHAPTFFHSKDWKSKKGVNGGMMTIDEVVEWSRTARGGRQFELFYEEAQDGCMRWGLCDSAGELDKPAD